MKKKDIQYNFSDLTWEEKNDSQYHLSTPITINTDGHDSVFIYFYMPSDSDYNKSRFDSWFNFMEIEVIPTYMTTCPVNYVSDCEETLFSMGLNPSIDYKDMENGGYFIFEMDSQKMTYMSLDNQYVYDLDKLDIILDDYSEELTDLLMQEGKMLIS